ncbi:centrosomal protein 43-like [Palaemon carinicauda]|uniref:centrosomal protein 43-like n=1 Tax=Palaemon carinicauda TaxID=392227 RepID=UPI0035B673A1
MSAEEDDASLKDLVTKTLQNNGVLGKIQAQLRASVFLALEEEFQEKNVPLVSPSVKQLLGSREGALAAALVQDFLQSLNLDFSLSVFAPESGHSALWNFPGKDAVKKDLNLDAKKGDGPLLLEILRERESSRFSKIEDSKKQTESQNNSVPLLETGKPSNPSLPPLNESKQLLQLKKLPLDIMEKNDAELKKLPLDDNMTNGDDEHNSLESQSGGNTDRTITNSKSLEEDNGGSEGSGEGGDKHYEEDFSSMSQKDGQEEEEEEGEEEEIEEEEDIEEDISDLINSSISIGSDHTKDQSLSQASDVPNYQENL